MFLSKSPFLVVVLVILAALSSAADDSNVKQECEQALIGLATCLPYITDTAKAPTPDCCAGLKQLLNTNKKCLCFAVQERNNPSLGIKVNVTLALSLPKVCSAPPINISECPALLGLPPNSTEARDFYQLAKNSSTGGNISPVAGGPTAAPPRDTPPRATPPGAGGASQSQNNGVRSNGMSFSFLPVFFSAACAVYYVIFS